MDVVSHWNYPTSLGLRELALETSDLLDDWVLQAVHSVCWQLEELAQQFAEVKRIAEHYHKTYVRGGVPMLTAESGDEVASYRSELSHAANWSTC